MDGLLMKPDQCEKRREPERLFVPAQSQGALSFGYFSLGTQRKVTRASARKTPLQRTTGSGSEKQAKS